MLEPNQNPILARRPRPPAVVDLAKWPPDDGDVPAGPPGGGVPAGGGSFGGGDGNFKKGRFSPVAILVGVLAVAGLGGFLAFGMKQDAERLTVEQAEQQKKSIFVLPKSEQLPKWQEWAKSDKSSELRAEALKQLAYANDPSGVDLAIAALQDQNEPVRAMAGTVLAHYGQPAADKARGPLLASLKTAGSGSKPQLAWALVVLGESQAFDEVMKLYRAGHLSQVQRLGGGIAFDPEQMVKLVSLDKLAMLAGDESGAVRQLVATVLSRNADPRFTDALIKLVNDPDTQIAQQAAPGLGKIGDERARQPLVEALKKADKDTRTKFLEALRDGIGTSGLVLALETIDQNDPNRAWFQKKQVFDLIHKVADPRGGDALLKYIKQEPHVHWQFEAASAMAEVGDSRAVPTLAKRLRMDPLKIYRDDTDYEMALKRDDNERVTAARHIADLATLHPDKRQEIALQSEDAVIFWVHELPSPHANGLRALAAMNSTKDIAALRTWANPPVPLPKEGQQPPMPEEWVIAQSAMRYVGWLKDQNSWGVLEKALTARPTELDVTMEGLMQGGVAILGMALRAIGVGAADGLAQWRDPKAFKPLLTYVLEPKNNEQSRMSACSALAWVARDEDMIEVAKKIKEHDKADKADQFIRACLLETLITRPVPGTTPALLDMMKPETTLVARPQLARAIGKAGIDPASEQKLFEMMNTESLMNDAALALMLGGKPETAARAVAMYADKPKAAVDDLQDLWYKSFGYWSTEDLDQGRIFGWIDNAVAVSRVELRNTPQDWAPALLMRQLENLDFDNGPHSFTRVVLRHRLWQMAKSDDAKRDAAVRTLKFMKEQGVLLALRDEQGPAGTLASAAYHELMNPKVVTGVKMPDAEEAKKQ
jgi:HEAT repeat protein